MTSKSPEHIDSFSLVYASRRLRIYYDAVAEDASQGSRDPLSPKGLPDRFERQSTSVRPIELPLPDRNARGQSSEMTIAEFVKNVFVPEHVAKKKLSGRTHYQAILKHVLRPEEVNCVFQAPITRQTKLTALPDWPYLSNLRLCDTCPDDVQRLISAALMRGYSTQTVKHIRNVVNAIYSHAQRKLLYLGNNPASMTKLPEMSRKEPHALTLAQLQEVLAVMRSPERELALMAILTGMNVTEICGLQWKCVNLTETCSGADDEPIPPRTIAVRRQFYRGQLFSVTRSSRQRDLPIPDLLLPVLADLHQRTNFTGPDDFVLVSRTGGPINEKGIAKRRLKPIGKDLQMPWLSWQVFRRTHKSLPYELGMQQFLAGWRTRGTQNGRVARARI